MLIFIYRVTLIKIITQRYTSRYNVVRYYNTFSSFKIVKNLSVLSNVIVYFLNVSIIEY